jgi:hypothetical protein
MTESPISTIPTKQEIHALAFGLAMASLENAFPGKKPEHLQPAALSISIKISSALDKLLDGVRTHMMEIN